MIKPKEKPCKGTTSETKGLGCGIPTFHRVYGLCKSKCYPQWLMETEAGKIKMQKAILKATQPRKDFEKAKDTRKEQNTLKNLLINVRMQLHAYIRKRDIGKPCISCGVQWNDSFHCTHFYKSEMYSNLRFDVDNLHGGCPKCNLFLDGNESGYRVGLLNRYGKEFVDALDQKAIQYKKESFKWDISELKAIKKEVQLLNKQF